MSTPYFQVEDQVWVYTDAGELMLGYVMEVESVWDGIRTTITYKVKTPLFINEVYPEFKVWERTEDQIRKVGEFTGRGPIQIIKSRYTKYPWMHYKRRPQW